MDIIKMIEDYNERRGQEEMQEARENNPLAKALDSYYEELAKEKKNKPY